MLCEDGDDVSDKSPEWWERYVSREPKLSDVFGAYWSTIRFACSGWRIRPNWTFKGPFKTPKSDASLVPGRPAAPLLFLTNRLDPVTPLSAARAMLAGHPGSAVVVQEAIGHCTIVSAPSVCTDEIVRDYLEFGTLPDEETSCNVGCGPWDKDCQPLKTTARFWPEHSYEGRLWLREFLLGVK